MAQNQQNNFTIKSGTITNGLLTACLVLGGIVYNGLIKRFDNIEANLEKTKTEISQISQLLNSKGILIEVNAEKLNSLERRVESIEKKVGYKYNISSFITLFKPEEEIKLKLKPEKNELS